MNTLIKFGLLASGLLLATGCALQEGSGGKYTGGGTLNSAGGSGKAQLAVSGDSCGGVENAKGNFTLTDQTAILFENIGGVKLKGKVTAAGFCRTDFPGGYEDNLDLIRCISPGWPTVYGTYTSTNPKAPGEGRFSASFVPTRVLDDTSGVDKNVVLIDSIFLLDGPFANYQNHGTMSGNIQMHECKIGTKG